MSTLDDIAARFKPIPIEIEEIPIDGVPASKEKKYFSLDEAVGYLEVTKRQIYRYIKAGKLKPHYRKVKGRKRLYLYSNQVKDLYPTLRVNSKAKDDAMDGFLALGEMIALGLLNKL